MCFFFSLLSLELPMFTLYYTNFYGSRSVFQIVSKKKTGNSNRLSPKTVKESTSFTGFIWPKFRDPVSTSLAQSCAHSRNRRSHFHLAIDWLTSLSYENDAVKTIVVVPIRFLLIHHWPMDRRENEQWSPDDNRIQNFFESASDQKFDRLLFRFRKREKRRFRKMLPNAL